MRILAKYWKALLALILILASVVLYFHYYEAERMAHESEKEQIKTLITALESSIAQNRQYAAVQDKLEDAAAEIQNSRQELYQHFPVELKEEDQILYVLYLEKIFGTEIQFEFSTPEVIVSLRDGSALMGLTLTVNYETTYQGFRDMINYLATDSRVTSVRQATIDYDVETDTAKGDVAVMLYLIDTDLMEYTPPDIPVPTTGKDNIYE